MKIDLNSDLGEGFGPWQMGDDAAMLDLVNSANIACGGHASDPHTMLRTVELAAERGVRIGAHPGYSDREGFGRRVIPMSVDATVQMVVAQLGALQAIARLADTRVHYLKLHGALANLVAADRALADAVVAALPRVAPELPILAISGTELEQAAKRAEHPVFSEVFADRAYQSSGQLLPRDQPGAVLHDAELAADRLLQFLQSGLMPVVDGEPIALEAHSICVHGDTPGSVAMARRVRERLLGAGCELSAFCAG